MTPHQKPERNTARLVTLVVFFFYLVFTITALARYHWNPMWFVWIGERYADLDPGGHIGYDGQFIYYLARDGTGAIDHLDSPAYRLQRILLPAFARLVSFGSPGFLPWALLLINCGAIVVTTWLLARWLISRHLPPWYSLVYALFVGTLMAYSRDLTEPLAIVLSASGGIMWMRSRYRTAIILLALAALAKETALIFVVGIVISEIFRKRLKVALGAIIAALPLLLWEALLYYRFGSVPLISGPSLELIPLSGIVPHITFEAGRLSAFFLVALPALVFTYVAIRQVLARRGQDVIGWWLLLNGILVLMMPLGVYDHVMHAGRNAAGLILSIIFVLPAISQTGRLITLFYLVLPTFVWVIPILRWAPWLSAI